MAKASKLKKTILGIAIALVLVFFWGYSVYTLYKEPERRDFCPEKIARFVDTREECDAENGKWIEREDVDREIVKPVVRNQLLCTKTFETEEGEIRLICSEEAGNNDGYCDLDYHCREEYDQVMERHGRNSFITLVALSLLSILIGGLLLKVETVSSGIMGGGVLTLLYAAMRYWGSIQDYTRLIILGFALVVLIWIGYRKLKD
ncbi:MAG: hypothetical protein KAK00_02950 [Nanoarchaeota archaeon]|nr:hypothetical protein [Nanoarchaeota archaeon]